MFTPSHVSFKQMPLFAVTHHQAKLAYANTAAMAQVQHNMHDRLAWILHFWDSKVDLTSYPGTSSPGNRVVPEPRPSDLTINQQIQADLAAGKPWLFDLLSNLRDAIRLTHNGLETSLGYNAATIVASAHAGRSIVLDNCKQHSDAIWMDQFRNSKYNGPHLFGDIPGSIRLMHERRFDSWGSIRLRGEGDVMRFDSDCKDTKTKSKSSSSSPSTKDVLKAFAALKRKQSFPYSKGAKASAKGQPQQSKPDVPAKSSNSKKFQGKKKKKSP